MYAPIKTPTRRLLVEYTTNRFFTPTLKSNWYRAYSDKRIYMGYVHKSKILMYKDCPPTIKMKMQHVWDVNVNNYRGLLIPKPRFLTA